MIQTLRDLVRLREEVEDRVRTWVPPEVPLLELGGRNDFFLATSSLQKAIRRNLENEAMTFASALSRAHERYLAWRLSVIALEDVGHGDVGLVEKALLIASDAGPKEQLGVERALIWLAGQLAAAPGNRAACELVVAASGHPGLRDDLIRMRGEADLVSALTATLGPPADAIRIAASIAELDRRGGLGEGLAAIAPLVGRRVVWIAETAHDIGVHGLEHGFLASGLLFHGHVPEVVEAALDTARIGPWLAPALDQYTRAGLRAIERFAVRCQPIATLLRAVPQRARTGTAAALVFGAEGGLLSRRVAYPASAALTRWCSEASLASAGAPVQLLDEGVAVVQSNLALLHEFRVEVLPDRWRNLGPGDPEWK